MPRRKRQSGSSSPASSKGSSSTKQTLVVALSSDDDNESFQQVLERNNNNNNNRNASFLDDDDEDEIQVFTQRPSPAKKRKCDESISSLSHSPMETTTTAAEAMSPPSRVSLSPARLQPKNNNVNNNNTSSVLETATVAQKAPSITTTKTGQQEQLQQATAAKNKNENVKQTKSPPSSQESKSNPQKQEKKKKNTKKTTTTSGKKSTFQEIVLKEMVFSCKPYTLKSLAKTVGSTETAVYHLMLSLLDKQMVITKEFGTTKTKRQLYWANQESPALEQVMLVPRQECLAAQQSLQEWRHGRLVPLEREIQTIETRELSNVDLAQHLESTETSLQELRTQRQSIMERINGANPKNGKRPRSAIIIKKQINAMRKEWKSRKEKCVDFIQQLADGLEKKDKDVIKLLDIETDEMHKVSMPPKHNV